MTAYHALDKDAQRTLLTELRDTSWSWKETDVPMLAARLGWEIVELSPTYGSSVDAGHGLGDACLFSFEDGRVVDVTLQITSTVPEKDAAAQLLLSDVFAETYTVATDVLGAPTGHKIGKQPQVRWRGDEATITLRALPVNVSVFWRDNEQQDRLDRIAENFYR